MAVFYTGYRPIERGQNDNDWVHLWKNKLGKYSNYSLMSKHQLLEGMPNTDVVPGAGKFPHGLQMSRRFRGLDVPTRLKNAGGGARIAGMRFRPLENKAVGAALVFSGVNFGHIARHLYYGVYSNWIFDGVTSANAFGTGSLGHARRAIGATGAAKTFGSFDPWVWKGTQPAYVSTFGQTVPTGKGTYGHDRVREWSGVASAKALNV